MALTRLGKSISPWPKFSEQTMFHEVAAKVKEILTTEKNGIEYKKESNWGATDSLVPTTMSQSR